MSRRSTNRAGNQEVESLIRLRLSLLVQLLSRVLVGIVHQMQLPGVHCDDGPDVQVFGLHGRVLCALEEGAPVLDVILQITG